MAPKKRAADDTETVKPTTESTTSVRVTRSSTRRVNGSSVADSVVQAPVNSPKKKKKKQVKFAPPVESPKKKKAKPAPEVDIKEDDDDAEEDAQTGAESKTVVIEHCKQCTRFKTRAIQVKNGLENGISGITVLVNPEKPRRGCFEIREEGGEKFISLLDMKRPFSAMTALDMDQVIAEILDKIK